MKSLLFIFASTVALGQHVVTEIPLTQWAGGGTTSTAVVPPPYNPGPTACTLGPSLLPVVGAQNPFCFVSSAAGPIRFASLDFSASVALTCITASLTQPVDIDPLVNSSRPFTLRIPYVRGPNVAGAQLQVLVAPLRDGNGDSIVSPPYGAAYFSEPITTNGNAGRHGMLTIGGIRFPASPGDLLMVQICRKLDTPADTSNGSLRLRNPLVAVWPVVER